MIPERPNPDQVVSGLLQEGEEVLVSAQIHWGIYWKSACVLFFSLILLTKVMNLGLFFFLVSVMMAAHAYLVTWFLRLVLTNKRVIIRQGIINLDVIQIHQNKIESVELARTIIGRILGYATVLITGTGSRVTVVPFVADPENFRRAMDKAIFEREEAK